MKTETTSTAATLAGQELLGRASNTRPRLESIDFLRGLVMVVMALDHVRDFFTGAKFDPTDLTQTNAAYFLTRWITHFCAPVFVFLAGTSAYLSSTRGKTKSQLSVFLLTRGLWLVVLELTVVHFGWSFNWSLHYSGGAVIWALGWSMCALAGLIYLPVWAVTAFGIIMIAFHNLLDGIGTQAFADLGWLWQILHHGGAIQLLPGYQFTAAYPLIPWIGVMAAGYGFGTLLLREEGSRRKWFLGLGTGLMVSFVLLRATNLYGDAQLWSSQKQGVFTLFSFLNCTKYPPSLLYLLMTLGPAIALLALIDRGVGVIGRPFILFGRVPLFYYLIHLPLLHGAAVLFAYVRHGRAQWLFENPWVVDSLQILDKPSDYGYGLPVVYAVWLMIVLILFPACRWFAGVKQRSRAAWLSYL